METLQIHIFFLWRFLNFVKMCFTFNENITVDPDCSVMLNWNTEGPGIYMGVLWPIKLTNGSNKVNTLEIHLLSNEILFSSSLAFVTFSLFILFYFNGLTLCSKHFVPAVLCNEATDSAVLTAPAFDKMFENSILAKTKAEIHHDSNGQHAQLGCIYPNQEPAWSPTLMGVQTV